jgi:hypothetical protein
LLCYLSGLGARASRPPLFFLHLALYNPSSLIRAANARAGETPALPDNKSNDAPKLSRVWEHLNVPDGLFVPLAETTPMRTRAIPAMLFVLLAPAQSKATELKDQTVQAWEAYLRAVNKRVGERAHGQSPFLWVDEKPERVERVRAGEVLVVPVDGDNPRKVPHGLIHHWIGAMFLPNTKLDEVMGVLHDYDHYKDFYKPMVVKSKLLERTQDHEKVTLLMMQKAFSVTAAVEIDSEILIVRPDADRAYSLSNSVRVQEIADYGHPREHALPEGHGPGYVWREFSVSRLEQRDGGVYVEIETIAMSRGIPVALRWMIKPLVENLPRKIMLATLTDSRDAVNQEAQAVPLKTETAARTATSR